MVAAVDHDVLRAAVHLHRITIVEHFVAGLDHQEVALRRNRCDFERAQLGDMLQGEIVFFAAMKILLAANVSTVDKFAMLAWKPEARSLFGWRADESRASPPQLIVQDELHLISGPLGTIAGLYETALDELCTLEISGKVIR